MGAWLISNPMGWIILLGGTIATTVGLVDLFTTSIEEHREKLESLKSEYSDVKSELDGLKGELDGTQSRINELESKGKLTFTEAEELNNLRKQNNELQRSIDLLELQNKIKKKELNNQFIETMNSDIEQELYTRNENDEVVQYMPMSGQTATDDNEANYINQRFKDLQKLRDELALASTEAEKERINRQIKGIEDYFIQKNKDFTETAEGIDYIQIPTTDDDKKVNEWLDYINDFQDKMAITMGGDNAKENAFNRLVDNWKFDALLNPLQQLGKEGKVTAEMLNDPKYDAFIQKLIDIEFISDDTEGSLRFVASAFNGTMQSARKYVTSLKGNEINNFIKNLSNEAKALGTTESELVKLTAAHVIFNNTGLSTEQQQQALQMLAAKIATTSEEMKYLLQLFNYASGNFDAAGASTMTEQERRARTVRSKQYLKDKYGIDLSPIKIPEKEDVTPYNPSDDDKDKGKDNTPDYSDPTDAIINRINAEANQLAKQGEIIESNLDLIDSEKDYAKAIDETNNLISNRTSQINALKLANSKLHNEADKARNSNSYTNEESWFDADGEETEAFHELMNSIKTDDAQEKLQNEFNKIQKFKKAYLENEKLIQDLTKENIKSTEDISDIASKALENHFDERNEISERWIQTQTDFDQLAIDGQIEAYARMVRNNREFLKEIEKNEHLSAEERDRLWKETSDKIVDYQLEAYNLVKEAIQQYSEEVEKGYDIRISRLNSESSLLSTHFDLINAISEEQHNLNKELAEAEVAGAKMNKIERQTLFTKEEHAKLTDKLNGLLGDAVAIQSDYLSELETATKETIEEITNNYERQYELKMKEYEVVKAELALVKAEQKLKNVENEKSVRTWDGTKWVYEADFQDVVDAKLAVEDAKYAVWQAQTSQAQQNALNAIDSTADSLETQKNLFAKTLEELSEGTKITGQQLTDALKYIAEVDLPTFEKIIEQFGDSLADAFDVDTDNTIKYKSSSKSTYADTTNEKYNGGWVDSLGSGVETATAYLPSGIKTTVHIKDGKTQETSLPKGTIISTSGGDYKITGGTGGENGYTSEPVTKRYALGTKDAQKGLAIFDENGIGSEYVLTKDGILHNFNMGDKVFNPKMGDNLYEAAQIDWKKVSLADFGGLASVDNSIRNMSSDTYYNVNGVNINSEEGGEIKGFVKFLKAKKI